MLKLNFEETFEYLYKNGVHVGTIPHDNVVLNFEGKTYKTTMYEIFRDFPMLEDIFFVKHSNLNLNFNKEGIFTGRKLLIPLNYLGSDFSRELSTLPEHLEDYVDENISMVFQDGSYLVLGKSTNKSVDILTTFKELKEGKEEFVLKYGIAIYEQVFEMVSNTLEEHEELTEDSQVSIILNTEIKMEDDYRITIYRDSVVEGHDYTTVIALILSRVSHSLSDHTWRDENLSDLMYGVNKYTKENSHDKLEKALNVIGYTEEHKEEITELFEIVVRNFSGTKAIPIYIIPQLMIDDILYQYGDQDIQVLNRIMILNIVGVVFSRLLETEMEMTVTETPSTTRIKHI